MLKVDQYFQEVHNLMTMIKVFFCFWQDIQDDIEDELSFEELVLLRSIAQKRAVICKVPSHYVFKSLMLLPLRCVVKRKLKKGLNCQNVPTTGAQLLTVTLFTC